MDGYRAMPRWHESETSTRGLVYDNAQMPRWHEYETSTRGLEYDNATVVFTPKPSKGCSAINYSTVGSLQDLAVTWLEEVLRGHGQQLRVYVPGHATVV